MNVIADTWRGLVRRRLWPLAVALVAGLVAVPFLLAKHPTATAAATPVAPVKAPASTATDAYVKLAQTPQGETPRRRRVLGARKDLFAPAPTPKAKKSTAKAAAAATATPAPTSTPAPSAGGGTAAPTTPGPAATPQPTVPKGTLKVRWSLITDASAANPLPTQYLAPLAPLGSDAGPVLVFEHIADGGKSALFSIPGQVTAVGDGKCSPSPADCETLKLHAHDTEFISITTTAADGSTAVAQYELDLVNIYRKKTVVPADSLTAATGSGDSANAGG